MEHKVNLGLRIRSFLADTDGQDGVEYALLIGFVVCLCAVGIPPVINALKALWTAMNTQLSSPG